MEDNKLKETKKTVLIVDDEKPIIDVLMYNMEREPFNLIEAYDGKMALEMAFKYKPDIILLDVMLPKIDGLTVCKRIKKIKK